MYEGIFKLIEEMGELQQELGKLAGCGDGKHPDGKGDMRMRVMDEIADVRAALNYFEAHSELHRNRLREGVKGKKFRKWGLKGLS